MICSKCNGTGKHFAIVSTPTSCGFARTDDPCRACNGMGYLVRETCKECGHVAFKAPERPKFKMPLSFGT